MKCLTGTEDHANESPASLKAVSRWPRPVHVAATLHGPFLLAKHWQAHYLICASRRSHEMAELVLLLSPSVDKANKMTGFIWGSGSRAGLKCRSLVVFPPRCCSHHYLSILNSSIWQLLKQSLMHALNLPEAGIDLKFQHYSILIKNSGAGHKQTVWPWTSHLLFSASVHV